MGNNTSSNFGAASMLEYVVEMNPPRMRSRSEERENLMKPQKMLRTGSVTKSVQRHLQQAKVRKPKSTIRRSKSVDYLREPHEDNNWVSLSGGIGDEDSDTDSVRPRIPNPSMQHGDTELTTTSLDSIETETETETNLCDTCRGINIETVSADGGYRHVLLSDIYATEDSCKICAFICADLNIKTNNPYTGDRYRINVSLVPKYEYNSSGSRYDTPFFFLSIFHHI
jgi:hypothetical protein